MKMRRLSGSDYFINKIATTLLGRDELANARRCIADVERRGFANDIIILPLNDTSIELLIAELTIVTLAQPTTVFVSSRPLPSFRYFHTAHGQEAALPIPYTAR
jgi:hypothetical protein